MTLRDAPFAEGDRHDLERILAGASPVQRAWLSGFLSGFEAGQAPPAAASPASPPRASEPLTILYASESGNSERLAADMAKASRKAGFKPAVVDFADLDLSELVRAWRKPRVGMAWGQRLPDLADGQRRAIGRRMFW